MIANGRVYALEGKSGRFIVHYNRVLFQLPGSPSQQNPYGVYTLLANVLLMVYADLSPSSLIANYF